MQAYEELEQKFGTFMGIHPDQVVVCSSGTAALHLALESLHLPQGSVVLLPDLCMVACARAVTMAGLTPVFVDCDEYLNMDIGCVPVRLLDGSLPNPPAAILAVHNYGRVCNMMAIHKWAEARHIPVIEDMAEVHGIQPHGDTEAACWSFYKNKTIGGEEGGCVAFPSRERGRMYAARARQLRSLGFTDAHDFNHIPRGHNYRLANLLAELIIESLARYVPVSKTIHLMEKEYDALCPPAWRMGYRDAPWVYDFRVPGMTYHQQDKAVNALRGMGIPARHCFKPMTSQEEYRGCKLYTRHPEWSVAAHASHEVIYVPFNMTYTQECLGNIFELVQFCLS